MYTGLADFAQLPRPQSNVITEMFQKSTRELCSISQDIYSRQPDRRELPDLVSLQPTFPYTSASVPPHASPQTPSGGHGLFNDQLHLNTLAAGLGDSRISLDPVSFFCRKFVEVVC